MAVDTAAPLLRRLPRLSFALPARRLGWPAAVLGGGVLVVATWLIATVAHELLIMALAVALPVVSALPLIDGVIELLPINYVYASAMVRYAGQIQPSGLAIGGEAGA